MTEEIKTLTRESNNMAKRSCCGIQDLDFESDATAVYLQPVSMEELVIASCPVFGKRHDSSGQDPVFNVLEGGFPSKFQGERDNSVAVG
jgi:hypothetical protein